MSDVAHSLKIKYGLLNSPSDIQIKLWVQKCEAYISQGIAAEEAGAKAAKEVFSDYQKIKYAAQADTITALLNLAKNR